MTEKPERPIYAVRRVSGDFRPGDPGLSWAEIPALRIGHYLWLDNGYRPEVEARLCRSDQFLHVRFRVGEERIRARYTKFQDPVYKDSCVEFFIDAFPGSGVGYVNFETNAIGTLLAAVGPDRSHRKPLWPEDLAGFEVRSSVAEPVDGTHGAPEWTLEYRVPLALFRKLYGREIGAGCRSAANFYKCGDETEFPHYGAWSPVETPAPDFHRPECFGEIVFE
ncbi:MAG: diguanylate cyclase [Candidatus Aminicenantes bacterium]|jgi:hypothetical protein|nr:diguanylate cyclase [Candidatus Aminicenantes bacterium]MBS1226307.1 diguanylate cyclase [Candidatus Aminicenantes bacterium]